MKNNNWYYWIALWISSDGKQYACSMVRVSEPLKGTEMIKQFMTNKPKLEFEPNALYIGKAPTSHIGQKLYENDDYDTAFRMYMEKKLDEMMVIQLVKTERPEELAGILGKRN